MGILSNDLDEPHSCSCCQRFVIDLRKTVPNWYGLSAGDEFDEVALDSWNESSEWPWTLRIIPFEVTVKDVIEAVAETGCVFCAWLVDERGKYLEPKDQESTIFLQTNNGSGPPSDIQGLGDFGTLWQAKPGQEAPFEPKTISRIKPGVDIFAHPGTYHQDKTSRHGL
jgi:hypothetical protein